MKNNLMEEDENIYKNFLTTFGEDLQFTLTFEEMGELAQALGKYLRKKDLATQEEKEKLISHISEEIADVKLCLEQLQYMFNSWEDVKERVKQKNLQLETDKNKILKEKS